MLQIHRYSALQDNYNYILVDETSGKSAVVDPSTAHDCNNALADLGLSRLDYILNTHHHPDHVGGNEELQQKWSCTIVGWAPDKDRIPGITHLLTPGNESSTLPSQTTFALGESVAQIYFLPGHTLGHIAYHFEKAEALFCGDVLFAMGCGRLFEGQPEQAWDSLQIIKNLPENTYIYCAHEYTLANGLFAEAVDGDNQALQKRMAQIRQQRQNNKPTVPFQLAEELQTNPFLRTDILGASLQREDQIRCFTDLRKQKDHFKA